MRRMLVGLMAIATAGCFQPKTCVSNDECTGGVCDPVLGVCITSDGGAGGGGGAMGGGTGGGGGDGGMGGGVGGGGDAGMGGGGGNVPQPYCADAGLSCADWQECSPTVDGGECVSAGYQLSWVTPDAGLVTKQPTLNGSVRVTKADGGSVALMSLPVTGAAAFSPSNGLYSGALPVIAPDGDKTFVAGWQDAGISSSLTITRDTMPPSVDVVVEPRPASLGDADPVQATAWKLDEAATIRVTVTNGIPATATNIQVPWSGSVTSSTCQATCTGDCRCFAVDLVGSTVNGLRDTAWLQVTGISDVAGNPAATVDAGVAVTRMKWARTMTLTSGSPLRPVAVSQAGTVIWGGQSAGPALPRLMATQQDGGTTWTAVTAGAVTAGPVVGTSNAWVASQTGTSQLDRVSLTAGTLGAPDCIAAGSSFTGDLALATPGGSEIPLGVRNGQLRAADGTCNAFPLPDAGNTSIPTLVVQTPSTDIQAFVSSQGDAKLWKQTLSGTTWTGNGWAALPSGTQPRGLFFDGTGRVGGGGGVAGNGAVFATDSAGTLAGTLSSYVTASNASAPVVGNGYVLWTSTTGVLTKVSYASGVFGSAQTASTGLGDLQAVMPLLGEGNLIYLLGPSGRLSVRRASSLAEVWNGDIAATTSTGTPPIAQLALDIHRGMNGSKDCRPVGVLYALTSADTGTDTAATLTAVLVDSKGLQADAPWPKYQRDNGNRGNISQLLTPWTCP